MSRLKYLLLLPILVYTNFIYCQSLESILESHFKIVGQAKLLEANSIIAKGALVQSGISIELVTYNKRPDKFRMEGRFEELTFVEVYEIGRAHV